MPSCRESTAPPPPPPAWTTARAQAALAEAACRILAVIDLLEEVHTHRPEPPDIDDRQEGRLAYDVATDVLTSIECVLEDNLRPAVETLHRSAHVTDAELASEFRAWLKRRIV